MAYLEKSTNWLPIFEVESDPHDDRFGSIKVHTSASECAGALDYFYGFSEEVFEQAGRSRAFVVANLVCDGSSHFAKRALLYMAACLADGSDEDVFFIKDGEKNQYEPLYTDRLLKKQRALFEVA